MNELNKTIKTLLKELGCSPARPGFNYLIYIIIYLINTHDDYIPSMKLYSITAEHFNTTSATVSGAIRKTVTQSVERANPELYQKVFSYTLNKTKEAPTCSEYIYTVVDYIRTDIL